RTAISWLERANLLRRDENVTNVFQARPLVKNLDEAQAKIASLNLSSTEKALWIAILREIFNTPPTESITVDQLALLPEFTSYAKGNPTASANPEYLSAKVFKILGSMTEAGLMKRDMRLTAFVRHKVADHSRLRLDRVLEAGGLGYAGIGQSVAVKFDLYNNSGEGSDSTGVYTNGTSPTVPALDMTGSGVNLHSGDIMAVHMTYDGATLTWTITDATAGTTFK